MGKSRTALRSGSNVLRNGAFARGSLVEEGRDAIWKEEGAAVPAGMAWHGMGWRVLIKNTEIMHEKSTFILRWNGRHGKTYMDTFEKSRLVW